MVELVDTLDSKSGFFGSGGSSPPTGTTSQITINRLMSVFLFLGFKKVQEFVQYSAEFHNISKNIFIRLKIEFASPQRLDSCVLF